MGDLRFTVPDTHDFDPRVWETAYITGIEGIPWQCHHELRGDQFSIGRQIDESGKLNIIWPSSTIGNVCLTTTSLRVAEAEYNLAVEIARGTVARLKAQTAEWQRVGLRLPDTFFPVAEESLTQLLRALTDRRDPAAQQQAAQRSINLALEASVLLCDTFSSQALEARRQSEGRLATLLGIAMPPSVDPSAFPPDVDRSCNLCVIEADLGAIESTSGKSDFAGADTQVAWATERQHKICMGPLVNFRRGALPRWMVLLEEDFESILRVASQHAAATLERYRGQVHIWNCAAGLNVPNELDWSDEQVLRMAVSLIETVRRADPRSPVLLTIDRPWSEYLRDDANGISPLHFADALIRAGLGLSGLALDLTMDRWPDGSFPRDLIEYSRLIDRWSMLGLPLMVLLNSPAEHRPPDPQRRVSNWAMAWESKGQVTPQSILRLLVSKPSVHAVIWTGPSEAPHQDLWNGDGKATPLLETFVHLRESYLH